MRGSWKRLSGTFCCLLAALTAAAQAPPSELPEDLFQNLEYRHIGPIGNRVIAVSGVPGVPNVYYLGAASGGIFKTTDGGTSWQPIFDDQPAASIGAIAIAPSDPNVVWAGTGETFIRANVSIGNGIYRSTDGGKNWRHMGLENTGRIGRVIVHPRDPDVVYAAALGHGYGPQEERGVFRTADGGDTWERVLHSGPNAGASDLVMDPANPRILFAGLWQLEINTWSRTSGGPESGLFATRDGGDTWKRLEDSGLPKPPWGKVGLTISARDPERVYALIETSSNPDFAPQEDFQGVLWRSDDGGESWAMISADNDLVQRPLYYSRALAAPDDADEIHFMAVRHSRSIDGGRTVSHDNQAGWDHHDIWIDPELPDRMIVGHDGGISISTNRGMTWSRPQLPIAQMYHAAVDDQIPYFVYGNRQDGFAARGPSNGLYSGGVIPISEWRSVGGCEVGFTIPSPADPDVVWSGCYDGILELFDARSGQARDVSVWPLAAESWPARELKYRFQWTFPLVVSRHDPRQVYAGSQYVHRTTDGGHSWQVISPDLTTDDPELQERTGGLTFDDAGPTLAPTLFALAESPLEAGVLWAGTNDGQIHLTRDGGETWAHLTANLPDLPAFGTVSNLEPSRHRAAAAYLTVDRHQQGDRSTYVYKTEDYGKTWRSLRADLPQGVFSYAHCVREDPRRAGLLYLGTENGVWVSFDDGGGWHPLQSNLPRAPVHWLVVQERFGDLVAATYGRGFWILDDLSPLRQLTSESLAELHLFAPRPAYRFHFREAPMMQPNDPAAGRSPEYGASIHYYLPPAAEDAESGDEEAKLKLSILDAAGEKVRVLDELPAEPGLQRVHWDLRYERTEEVKLRTKPAENPHVEIPDQGWRELVDGGRLAILAPPGLYTVKLEMGETAYQRELVVLKEPSSTGNEAEIERQMEALFRLRDLVNDAATMINELEWGRKQLADLEERLGEGPEDEEMSAAAKSLGERLGRLEGRFFDLRMTQARQDSLRWKRLLYSRLTYLARRIMRADYPPTSQQLEVLRELEAEIGELQRQFEALRVEVGSFNELLQGKGVAGVILSSDSSRLAPHSNGGASNVHQPSLPQ